MQQKPENVDRTQMFSNLRRYFCTLIASATAMAPMASVGKQAPPDAPYLEHIGIYAASTERTAAFLNDIIGLRLNTVKWEIKPDTPQSGGVKLGFIDGNGMQFTLIEPTTPGPTLDELRRFGNGAVAELDFEVADFNATYDLLESRGVGFVNMDGKPFPAGQRGWHLDNFGISLVYLPKDLSHGMTIEIYQRGPRDKDILHARDRMWEALPPVRDFAPRLRRTLVLAKDLDATAGFLEQIMRLSRTGGIRKAVGMRCLLFDAGGGAQIELVEPTQDGPIKTLLETKGDGFAAGLVFESQDLKAFGMHTKSKGVQLVSNHSPGEQGLVAGCEAVLNSAAYASIPMDAAEGMRITIAQPRRGGP